MFSILVSILSFPLSFIKVTVLFLFLEGKDLLSTQFGQLHIDSSFTENVSYFIKPGINTFIKPGINTYALYFQL